MDVRMGKRFIRLLKECISRWPKKIPAQQVMFVQEMECFLPHYTNVPCPDYCTFGDCPHTRRADGTSNKVDSPKAWFDLALPKHKAKYAQL